MVDGIVLAGGKSSRLGQNKMNIMFKGKTVIQHTIEQMRPVCDHIFVITGFYHEEISRSFEPRQGLHFVFNPDYEKGMFTSVKKGVACTKNDFFIIPGDYPLVKTTTYRKILLGAKGIRVPSFSFKLGHPIYFSKIYKKKILEADVEHLKAFRNKFEYEMINVDDKGILFDIDTFNDVKNLKKEE